MRYPKDYIDGVEPKVSIHGRDTGRVDWEEGDVLSL